MNAASIARLVVPAGTAAACVVATEPFEDPALEARRFARCAHLPAATQLAQIVALVRDGVCAELRGQTVVLRVIAAGVRHHAAVMSIGPAGALPVPAHLLQTVPSVLRATGPGDEKLLLLLQAEARQRPIFHGTTPAGTTYSGFAAADPDGILAAVAASLPQGTMPSALAAVFADEPIEIPPGLLIALAAE